jgi:negative regulator of flagellin synthesis FlgM
MKITGIANPMEIYNPGTQPVKKAASPAKAGDVGGGYEPSGTAKDFQFARNAVHAIPDVRADLIGGIMKRMEEGAYNVSPSDVADKILALI